MVEAQGQALAEKLVAHAAVEALAKAVLHRLPRRDETPIDPALLSPGEHGAGGELRSVAGHDGAWLSTPRDQIRRLARHASARNRGVRHRRQAFARHVVDDVQDVNRRRVSTSIGVASK
jgi:hypothetical protein